MTNGLSIPRDAALKAEMLGMKTTFVCQFFHISGRNHDAYQIGHLASELQCEYVI